MGESAIPILESFGGLETDTERTSRTPGRASLCVNMRVGGQGRTLRKMQGASRWVNDQMGGAVNVLGFFQFKDRGLVRFDVAKVPTDYFITRDGGPIWDKAHTVTSSTGIPRFVTANGQLYVVDGLDALFWDGTGTGTARFSNWFRLRGPTSGTVGPNNVDSPVATVVSDASVADLAVESEYEVGFFFTDSGNATKKSAPSAIMQVRTGTGTNRNIRIDTGYAGRKAGATSTADDNTTFHHLPSEVAALDTAAQIAAIASKAGVPGVWYQDDTAGATLQTRVIPIGDTLSAGEPAGETSLAMTTSVATTLIRVGDQLNLSPDADENEVVRVTAVSGSTITTAALKNAHSAGAKAIPIISLLLVKTGSVEPGTTQYTDFYGPPRGATGIVSHFDALWTWGSPNFPTRLWFTDPDAPETFPTQNFIDVEPDNPFDPIVNIVPFGKGFGAELLILRKNSVWRLGGNSITTFLSQLVQVGPSCVDVDSAVAVNDGTVMWGGSEAVWRFDGSTVLDVTKDRIRHDYRAAFALTNVAGALT